MTEEEKTSIEFSIKDGVIQSKIKGEEPKLKPYSKADVELQKELDRRTQTINYIHDTTKNIVGTVLWLEPRWAEEVYDWLHEFDKGALSAIGDDFAKPHLHQLITPLVKLGHLQYDMHIDFLQMHNDVNWILLKLGVQSHGSLLGELKKRRGHEVSAGFLEAVIRELVQLDQIWVLDKLEDRFVQRINRDWPGTATAPFYVRR